MNSSSSTLLALIAIVAFVAVVAIWPLQHAPAFAGIERNVAGSAFLAPSGRSYTVAVWVAPYDPESTASAAAHAGEMDIVSPIWYQARSDGTISAHPHASDNSWRAAVSGALLIPTIESGGERAFLDTPEGREAQANRVVQLVLDNNFPGIDIDYEVLPVEQREEFSAYVELLAGKLHAQGKTLSVTVHPKWNDGADYTGAGAQDWALIGQHADHVRIMLYGFSGSTPGPMAPLYWVDGILDYAEQAIPNEKIFVGIPWYGKDWTSGGSDAQIPYSHVQQKIDAYSPSLSRDKNGELFFEYTEGSILHTIYFPDAHAYEQKLNLILTEHSSVGGFVHYRAGREDAAVWPVLGKTSTTPSTEPFCNDPDGEDTAVRGTATSESASIEDACLNSKTCRKLVGTSSCVSEAVCANGEVLSVVYPCSGGCSGGVCTTKAAKGRK